MTDPIEVQHLDRPDPVYLDHNGNVVSARIELNVGSYSQPEYVDITTPELVESILKSLERSQNTDADSPVIVEPK